jgi:capsid protein
MIGDGFKLAAKDPDVDALWEEWYPNAEITGRYKGNKLDRAVALEWLTTGEGIGLKIKGGSVQLIESEQVPQSTGAVPEGIITDDYGKPIEFRVAPYVNGNLGRAKKVNARDVLFICERERPSSLRGIPVLQQAFPMLHRINDVLDSEALGFQILSRVVMKHLSDTGPLSKGTDNVTADATTDDVTVTELPFGLIFEGSINDELVPMERSIPGKDFPQSVATFCRFLGLPLGLPLELVLLDWTKSNFSQMRGALLMCDKRFRGMQASIINDWHEPLFQWKRQQWIAEGLIEDTPETMIHEWIPAPFPWVDPEKEAMAQGKIIELGLGSHTNACKARSIERARLLPQLDEETREAIEISKKIEAETGVVVPWQHFAGRAVGKTESAVVAKRDDSDAPPPVDNGKQKGNEDDE